MLKEHNLLSGWVKIFYNLNGKLNRFFLLITLILSFVTVVRIGYDLHPTWIR
ncbi:MAG: hypothetical protein HS132_06795 [Planctomycetia bacterium]|nr:hypothetical protein [Planctomycetia bacterium]